MSALRKIGFFDVRIGPEFSGKTVRLIKRAYIHSDQTVGPQKKSKKVLIVRPGNIGSAKAYTITSHIGLDFNINDKEFNDRENVGLCLLLKGSEVDLLRHDDYDVYLIDDGHYFSENLALVLSQLCRRGKDIYYTGRLHIKDDICLTTVAVMSLPEISSYKVLYNQAIPHISRSELKVKLGPKGSTKTIRLINKALNTNYNTGGGLLTRVIFRPQSRKQALPNIFKVRGRTIDVYKNNKKGKVKVEWIKPGEEEKVLRTEADLYLFDDIHLFDISIIDAIKQLVKKGKDVSVYGRFFDSFEEIYPTSMKVILLPEVTNLEKLWTQCPRCSMEGMATAKFFGSGRIIKNKKDDNDNSYEIGICYSCKWQELGLL